MWGYQQASVKISLSKMDSYDRLLLKKLKVHVFIHNIFCNISREENMTYQI